MSEAVSEFEAIQTMHRALEPLDGEARARVLTYITSLLGIDVRATSAGAKSPGNDLGGGSKNNDPGRSKQTSVFVSFAELYAAANPASNGEKALVAGYWLQVCQEAENFTAAAANKELTNLGYKVANITDAIDSMKNHKPMLILQIQKSGTSRQARKLYKLSHEGEKRIQEMISG